MRWARTARARLDDESGVSLLEVVIATFVLAVAIVALAGVASASLVQVRASRDRQAATDAATSRLERMRLADFASIAMLASEAPGTCDGSTDEPHVTTTDTDPDSNLAPYEQTGVGPAGNITVRTIVTWYDDPDDGDQSCSATPNEVKRVRVVASWLDGAVTREVSEETLVSPANRGLPLPKFRLGGESQTLHFESAEITTPTEQCLEHVLRNVGAPDRYELTVERNDGATKTVDMPGPLPGSSPAPQAGEYGYDFPNAGQGSGQGTWYVRAELEYPIGSGTIDDFDAPGTDPTRRIKGDDAFAQVPTSEQAVLRVCYIPTSTVGLGETYEFKLTVSSRFDDNEAHEAFHTLTTGTVMAGVPWYLYDTNDTVSHTRADGVVYTMGVEQGAQPDIIGTGSLKDYDTNRDPDGHGGIRLEKSSAPGIRPGVWHEQVSAATTIAANMRLILWVAADDALDEDPLPSDGAWDQELFVEVKVLRANETTVDQVILPPTRLTWSQTEKKSLLAGTDGWVQQTWTLPNAAFNLKKNQFLQIRIWCGAASDDECHIAYDNASYKSRLQVEPS